MLFGLSQGNVSLGVFQDTKVMGRGGFALELIRYQVAAAEATSPYHGGSTVFYCKAGNFSL